MSEEKSFVKSLSDTSINPVQETVTKFLETANVSAVYGEPIQHGETLIIPAAEVLTGMGFGMGYGGGESADEENKPKDSGGGGGGGGGGRVLSRPVAVIIADQHGVRVEPVVDPTKIAIALFTTLGFMAAMAGRMSRKKPRLEA
jgi:uncharacterized spore protein YtfJ